MNRSVIEAEYVSLLASVRFTRIVPRQTINRMLSRRGFYEEVFKVTNVPVLWLMVINERESSSDMNTYMGNGDPLHHRTIHVPRGRGPFSSWPLGAEDALKFDKIDQVADWTTPRACYEAEVWNGFGYRKHGRHSAYVWAGTNVYTKGFYSSDGHWEPNGIDPRCGVVALMKAVVDEVPELILSEFPGSTPYVPPPAPVPSDHDVHLHDVEWLQTSLNTLILDQQGDPLKVDGNFGRRTRTAVRAFQQLHGLTVDGIAGPETVSAIEVALAAIKSIHHVSPTPSSSTFEPSHKDLAYLVCALYELEGFTTQWDVPPNRAQEVVWAVKYYGSTAVVVFEGTHNFKDLVDDLQSTCHISTSIGDVHAGFYHKVPEAVDDILHKTNIGCDLILVGHSLGAARATLAAGLIFERSTRRIRRVTFGEPRFAFMDYVRNICSNIPYTSYLNTSGKGDSSYDWVVDLPPAILGLPYAGTPEKVQITEPPTDWSWGPLSWHQSELYFKGLRDGHFTQIVNVD